MAMVAYVRRDNVVSWSILVRFYKKINYLINYRKSYYVQFGQTRVFLIAVCEHSKAVVGRLEKPQGDISLW